MKRRALFLTLTAMIVLALLAGANAAPAQSERILNCKSFITVHPDASMTVTEDITVQANRQEIKRGIIRDFPTTYRDRLGNTVTVGFKVEEVLRDGRPEPYRVESASNGAKILKSAAYTGYQGDRGQDFTVNSDNTLIVFKTTRGLAAREGLTVAVSWPKGVVQELSSQDRMGFFLRDNVAIAIGLIWLSVLLGFYLWAWYRVGRGPAGGTPDPTLP